MAVSHRVTGTWAELTADGAVTIPATPQAGDRMFLFASWKAFGVTATASSAQGAWTEISEFTDGSVASGSGTGSVKVACWYRDWVSGDGDPTIDFSSSPTVAQAVIMVMQKGGSDVWGTPHAGTAAMTNWTTTSQTVTSSSAVPIRSGGVVMGLIGIRDDSATMTRPTTGIDVSSGVTWNGNYVESPATHASSTTGDDMSCDLGYRLVTTGTSIEPRMTGTISAAETGAALWIAQGLAVIAAAGGGDWTTNSTWVGGVAPLAADDAYMDGTSGNVVIVGTSRCRSLTCTGYTGTLSGTGNLLIGDATAGAGSVALLLVAGMTVTASETIQFQSTSATQQTITTAGKTLGSFVFAGVGGSWILSDAVTVTAGSFGTFTVTSGTLNTNSQSITCKSFASSGAGVRSITFGTSALTVSGADARPVNFQTTTNLTFSGASSTFNLTDVTAANKEFHGGGLTFGTVNVSAGGAGTWTILGNNTFAKLNRSGTGTKTIKFTSGGTTTLSPAASDAFFSGTAGNLYTIEAVTGGLAANLSMASGTLSCEYISLKDSAAAGGATFNAANSTDVSGNSGWNFNAAGNRRRRVIISGAAA